MDEQQFEWDDSNIAHLARHAVSTDEAEQAILDPDAVVLEIQSGNEDRVKAVGMTRSGRILEVVFTFRAMEIQPITAYDATARTQRLYLRREHSMKSQFVIPKFQSEAEEAQWWFDHREESGVLIEEAVAAGRTSKLSDIIRIRQTTGNTPTVSIRIDPADLSRARMLAERRGLRYQTYLKMILHEALERDDRQLAS